MLDPLPDFGADGAEAGVEADVDDEEPDDEEDEEEDEADEESPAGLAALTVLLDEERLSVR